MKHIRRKIVPLLGLAMLLTGCGEEKNSSVIPTSSSTPDSSIKASEEKKVSKIEVTKMPNKTEYEIDEKFDPTGMEVTATYDDDSTEKVTSYSYDKTGELTLDDTEVTILYKGKTTKISITVKFVLKLSSINIEELPTKTTYVVGDHFDPTGMKVTAVYNDKSKKIITDYTYDKHEGLTLQDKMVTISYTFSGVTKTSFVPIMVVDLALEKIEVTTNPTKLNYLVGEKFDATGMVVSAVMNNGTKEVITDYSIDKKDKPLTLEDTSITITYQDKSVILAIVVSEAQLTKIEITTQPTKTSYYVGETFDPTGMVVTATYEDDSTEVVNNYTYDKTEPLTLEDTLVTINFGGMTATLSITVEVKYDVKINALGSYRMEAENLDTSKAFLREDFIAAGRTFVENGAGASNGANICGYNPGSVFEISIYCEEATDLFVSAIMSDTDTNYALKDSMTFLMDDVSMTPNDVQFTYAGGTSYWEWKSVEFGTISLAKGAHTFRITSIDHRPNLDCFDFEAIKYGDQEKEKVLTGIEITAAPTKTTYTVGETFDPTGMEITATYSNHHTEVITDYTIDKTEPLTISDEEVTISYQGFTATVKITVGKAYQLKLTSLGDHYFEAEDFDTSKFVARGDMASMIQASGYTVSAADAHNGKSIERYDNGSVMSLEFYAVEDIKTDIILRASNYDEIDFNATVEVKLDDTVLTTDNPSFGHRYNGDWYNWMDATVANQEITKGEHTLTITMISAHPNLDCLNFHVSKYAEEEEVVTLDSISVEKNPTKMSYYVGETFDPTGMEVVANYSNGKKVAVSDYTIDKTGALTAEDKTITISYQNLTTTLTINVKEIDLVVNTADTYRLEAENLDKSNLTSDGTSMNESNGLSSNGASLGHVANGYFEIRMDVKEDYNLKVIGAFSKYESVSLSDYVEFFMDDQAINFTDITLGRAEDGSNDWFNWKEVELDCGDLTSGTHVFKVNFKSGCNMDYLDFVFSSIVE